MLEILTQASTPKMNFESWVFTKGNLGLRNQDFSSGAWLSVACQARMSSLVSVEGKGRLL
jgi:hypothetical protein